MTRKADPISPPRHRRDLLEAPERSGAVDAPRRCAPPTWCKPPRASAAAARAERLVVRADRAVPQRDPRNRAALRPGHLPEPARDHHRRADDGRLRLGGHAGELPPLELRQGVHLDREELQARPHGAGVRDRHQLQPLHQLPDGGEHDGHAGPRDRARRLRPQQLLQGQLPVPHVDRCGVDHRLPRLRAELRGRLRRAARPGRGGGVARQLPRADEPRRGPLPPPEPQVAGAGAGRAQGPRGLRAAAGQRHVAHAAAQGRQGRPKRPPARASPKSRRRTCCTSSRRTRRCSNPGSARSCASCARWRSTSTRSARRR